MGSYTRLHRGSLDTINGKLLPIDKTGLVAYYPFWQNSGTTLYDESKNGNDGTINGATWTWDTTFNKPVLSFDGTDDEVPIPCFDLTGSHTVLLWMKPANLTQTSKYLFHNDNRPAIIWEYNNLYSDNAIEYYENAAGTIAGGTISDTNWHHAAASWDGSTVYFYIDGSQVDSGSLSSTSTPGSTNNAIGSSKGGNYFAGSIHGVLVYGRALSTTEIATIYEKTRP